MQLQLTGSRRPGQRDATERIAEKRCWTAGHRVYHHQAIADEVWIAKLTHEAGQSSDEVLVEDHDLGIEAEVWCYAGWNLCGVA